MLAPAPHIGCPTCGSLPDDITANTGREEYLPTAYRSLESMDGDSGELLRCPACNTYYNWIDMPQYYGSGNCDEERLVRLSQEQSHWLDKLLTSETGKFQLDEVDKCIEVIPLNILIIVLRYQQYEVPAIVSSFLPRLVRWLGKTNDTTLWSYLNGYVYKDPNRAKELLDAFRSDDEYPPNRMIQILHHCLRVIDKANSA